MSTRRFLCAATIAVALSLFSHQPVFAQSDSPYPFQGQAGFVADLSVTDVDIDRQRVMAAASDGTVYTVDTQDAAIVLRDTKQPGETGDLIPGMRLHVVGTLLPQHILAADRVEVLPYQPGRVAPVPPPAPADDRVTLRGTVAALDDAQSGFTLHVRDHARRIVIDDQSDLSGLAPGDPAHQGVHVGERVTVVGAYQPDGAILADLVTVAVHPPSPLPPHRSRRVTEPVPASVAPVPYTPVPASLSHLTGEVSSTSNKLSTRDIKVRVSPSREVTVHVPHDAQILRDGRPLSVHNIAKGDIVSVEGTPDGDAVKASRIVVLPPL